MSSFTSKATPFSSIKDILLLITSQGYKVGYIWPPHNKDAHNQTNQKKKEKKGDYKIHRELIMPMKLEC